ncbi:MAG: hypothetical protein ACLU4N_10870 [Butyricimonas faecihominis]
MKTLARWYDMEVVYLDESIKIWPLQGNWIVGRYNTDSECVAATDKLTVEVNGKRIVLGVNKNR